MEYEFTVKIPDGLHARPCAKLVEILKDFQPLQIISNEKTVDNLSILELLLLKIPHGTTLRIVCNSQLPIKTIEKLNTLFSNE